MKRLGQILSIIILLYSYSPSVFGDVRDSVRQEERKKAKIERKRNRIMNRWDERTMVQKKTDRRVLLFLAISAGVLVKTISNKE
ncbi:MAG TPA: hypothetical protein VK508_02095 [Cyclobacteriaceae bacterium]|nr:hypothetical protein [Cyclobacteriaceae bacterium]